MIKKHKSNPLKRLFLFIVIVTVTSTFGLLYIQWRIVKNTTSQELIYVNKLMTNSVRSMFQKNEALLKVVGERLISYGALKSSSSKSVKLVKHILKDNPNLVGLGLANTSGQLVLTSDNLNKKKLPNLLHNSKTKESFIAALKSKKMVIGRTYFMKALKEWVIPLRYRITNLKGKVVAVMTTGLKLVSYGSNWGGAILPSSIHSIVIRNDYYRQYISQTLQHFNSKIYSQKISQKKIDKYKALVQNNIGNNGFAYIDHFGKNNIKYLAAISFDSLLGHYTIIAIAYSKLYKKMISTLLWLVLLLTLFLLALYRILLSNIKLQINAKQQLDDQASHDQLTGLPNRYYLQAEFENWRKINSNKFSLLFMDLNNFKSSNDLHGHKTGDKILQQVSLRLRENFPNCIHIRHGGDEFILLVPVNSSLIIYDLCKKFLQNLKKPLIINGIIFEVTASIGIVLSPIHGNKLETLLRKADIAMYTAKNKTVGIELFSQRLEHKLQRKAQIEQELIYALENHELHLVYQPQVDAQNQSIIGFEALLRWKNKNLGIVGPDEFIPIAEATGLIIDIGLYVLESAVSDSKTILQSFESIPRQEIRIAVNVSVSQLLNHDFINWFSNNPNKCKNLTLEITESLFIEDIHKIKSILEGIASTGVLISLDDFGTGYSSLSVLSKLPIHELKIDRSFVNDIMTDETDKQLIRSIINLGKSLDITVLAEGVEDKHQVDFLAKHGCNFFQGYYFSKPLELENLMAYIKKKKD